MGTDATRLTMIMKYGPERLVREGHIAQCGPQALALYLLLVMVADAEGLSAY